MRRIAAAERNCAQRKISRSPGNSGFCSPDPHLVHSGQDPAVVLADGADLSNLPGSIVGKAKLHKLPLQGRGPG